MIFKHGGDLGDTVLFLPNLAFRPGSSLLLNFDGRVRCPYSVEHANLIIPLVCAQDYVRECRLWCDGDELVDVVDGNSWRGSYNGFAQLCHSQVFPYGTPLWVTERPWLWVEPKRVARVVVNRSLRYAGNLDYSIFKNCDCVFVGLWEEYVMFCSQWFELPWYETKDLLSVAEVIQGAELFVGNQSCCYAIAEGLKKNLVQDTCVACPNNIVVRAGAKYSLYDSVENIKSFAGV
jgi:hypothetical protein